jgi:hypothetical protein
MARSLAGAWTTLAVERRRKASGFVDGNPRTASSPAAAPLA